MKTKNSINQFLLILFISVLFVSANTASADAIKCTVVDPGSPKSANAEAVLTGATGVNIANFNVSANGDTRLNCPSIEIKKMSFIISSKNTIPVKNITLALSGSAMHQLVGTVVKNTVSFVFPPEYKIKPGESVHFSMYADVGKIDAISSGQLQVSYKTMEMVSVETKKPVKSPKAVVDDLKLLVLNDVDQYIFKSLSRIRNEVRVIELTGIKGHSFCIDEKNTIPKLLKFNTKNAIDKKTGMCR